MKKEFAVNPDLTSMPLTYLGRIPAGMDCHGDVDRDSHARTNESHPHVVSCSVFPLLFAFVSSLFQIDTNKSITQKRLKKVSEPVAILSF